MTSSVMIECDAPGCTKTIGNVPTPFTSWSPSDLYEYRARKAGWTKTRVQNPLYTGTAYQPKTLVLHRCPDHADMLLRVEMVEQHIYRIIIKPSKKAADAHA